ncbi:VOC family protein [Sphingomonas sp. TX0543]|uniref:VOC family protein n=1 Tax=unclassified Sphingomonas TaxID=196159 RepID=UPI0010F59288|nr:VOC family protein [Sphingomonas sp. 3P27F8]
MTKMIFVNLPVANVAESTAFYEAIGMRKNEMFSNEHASSMEWSDTIVFMLLDHGFYSTFTTKTIIDAKTQSGALIALSLDSRAQVDALAEAALAAGGREAREKQDLGFMYARPIEDLDGHTFEPMYMDMAAFEQATHANA